MLFGVVPVVILGVEAHYVKGQLSYSEGCVLFFLSCCCWFPVELFLPVPVVEFNKPAVKPYFAHCLTSGHYNIV